MMPRQLLLWFCAVFLVCAVQEATCTGLQVAYEWRQIDYAYRTAGDREAAIATGAFVRENVIPVGVERHGRRLFVTLPRWKTGVPASLAYIDLDDTTTKSPLLHPYPSWGAHSITTETITTPPILEGADSANSTSPTSTNITSASEIISPFRVRADRCNRLWVLDTGTVDILGDQPLQLAPTQLLVYDLHNDNLLRRFQLPATQLKHDSFFANIAVEVVDGPASGDSDPCANTYAYLADLGAPGLVVYSWRDQESWRVHHHYFHPDPLAGDYNVAGTRFQWDDGLFGVALSAGPAARLYFHALSSTTEFSVATAVLRNRTRATETASGAEFAEFRAHGSRGDRGQAGATFWADGVLFYTQPNRNALTCWRPAAAEEGPTSNLTAASLGVVYESDVEMVFPNDVKVDAEGGLWVLTDNLQRFTYGRLDASAINYRILRGTVSEAIRGTVCEASAVEATTTPATPSTTEHDHRGHVHLHEHGNRPEDGQRKPTRPVPSAAASIQRQWATLSGVSALLAIAVASWSVDL